MRTFWFAENMKYNGAQLAPLYNYLKHGILGDSIVAWVGGCDVSLEHMMDGEDLRQQARIEADQMLHFVLELFHFPLSTAVALQRLMGELLIHEIRKAATGNFDLKRHGDDIYFDKRKLNISIATCSHNSSLIHYGVNVSNAGTPVPTCSLQDFAIENAEAFARSFMEVCKDEVLSLRRAEVKVRTF